MANQGAIGYNGSNVMLVHNDNPTDMSLVAMLASCSPVPCKVRSVGGGLEDSLTSCGQRLFFSPTFEASAEDRDEDDDCSQPVEKKRRLSFDQVKSLEKSFELENRLDPERKTQLAQDLKLQPRQVSVWFQNRRARWKTKKLEGDFEVLTADYNRLKGELEVLLDENKQLQIEVNSLTAKVRTSQTSHAVGYPPEEKVKSKTALTPPSEKSEKLEPAPPELNTASSENGSQSVQARIEEASVEVSNREAFSSGSVSSQISNVDSRPYSGSLVPPENIVQPQVSLEMDSNFIHMGDNLFDQMLSPASQSNSFKPEDVSNEDDASNFYWHIWKMVKYSHGGNGPKSLWRYLLPIWCLCCVTLLSYIPIHLRAQAQFPTRGKGHNFSCSQHSFFEIEIDVLPHGPALANHFEKMDLSESM